MSKIFIRKTPMVKAKRIGMGKLTNLAVQGLMTSDRKGNFINAHLL